MKKLFAVVILMLACPAINAFEVSVTPKIPTGGQGFLLTLSGKATGYYEISYNAKSYVPYDSGDNNSEIYLPVGIEAKGKKSIVISNILAGGVIERKTLVIRLKKRAKKVVYLKESDEKLRADQPIIDEQNRLLLDKIRSISADRFWNKKFIMPLKGRLVTSFALQRKASTYAYFHKGVDFGAPKGRPVKAANDGRVIFAKAGLNVYGNALVVDHGQGIVSCYFHLDRLLKREGDRVAEGEVIAEVGATGWATGPHLHFGVYLQGEAVDPLWWVNFAKNKTIRAPGPDAPPR